MLIYICIVNDVILNQKHFLCTIDAPHSWYSCLVTHMVWKVDRLLNIDPPIQTENFLSGGANILTFMFYIFY